MAHSTKKKKEEVTSLDSDAQFFTPLNPEDNQPSVYKGYVTVSYAAAPVAYRIVDVAHTGIEGRQCHTLAVSSFRMSILMADIVRGKMSTEILRKAASATVIERLQRLAYIVGEQMRRDQAYRAKLRIPPVMLHWQSGTLINEGCLETCVQFSLGREIYWTNLRFERVGCRWVCTFADIG